MSEELDAETYIFEEREGDFHQKHTICRQFKLICSLKIKKITLKNPRKALKISGH